MPVILKFKNADYLFSETTDKIIINDLTLEKIEMLKNATYVDYEDSISLIPQCACGELRGAYLKGEVCHICGVSVTDRFQELKPVLWVRQLRDDLPFISPYIWGTINSIIGKDDSMRWLADTTYNPPSVQPFLHTIAAIIGGRGYLNVINNIDKILDFIKGYSKFKKESKQLEIAELQKRVKHKEDYLFSFLPLLNKNLFVAEKSNKDIYTSAILGNNIDLALMILTTLNNPRTTAKRLEITTAKLVAKMATLFSKYIKDNVAGKKKLVRKHLYGTRANFTARAVITSIPGKHEYDELHIPWKVAVPLLRPHLLNLLIKRGYNYRQASDKILAASTTFDSEINELFNYLIDTSPTNGLPALFHRNQIDGFHHRVICG